MRRLPEAAISWSVLVAAAVCGCKEPAPRGSGAPDAAEPPSGSLVAIDASAVEMATDPPLPAGDLKAELERFTSVTNCVADHAAVSPLVADAIGAIGYDTLLHDACRMLESAKLKDAARCAAVESRAMRARCATYAAWTSSRPDDCPLTLEGEPQSGRDPTCVAVAARDPRLCRGAPAARQGTCAALVTGSEAPCSHALPARRAACLRELSRFRSVLGPPLAGLVDLPAASARWSIRGDKGTADPPSPQVDAPADVEHGVVLVTARTRATVRVGLVDGSGPLHSITGAVRAPRVAVTLLADGIGGRSEDLKLRVERLVVEVPGEVPMVRDAGAPGCDARVEAFGQVRGAPMRVRISCAVASGTKAYRVEGELTTFVRDRVDDRESRRLVPPAHPLVAPRPPSSTRATP